MSFDLIDGQFIDTLESSGIIDAYEYVLRKLISDNLPRTQVYEKCARYLLEYQKLVLANNIRAKNAQSFYELSNIEEEKKKEIKAKEILPSIRIPLKSRLLFEQEENKPPQKIFETNIDELIKNKLNLLSKNKINEQLGANLKGYGSFAAYVENENEKLRMHSFKIDTKFTTFQFTPFEEIEKGNYDNTDINSNLNINNVNNNVNKNNMNNINVNNNNDNLNSEAEFIVPPGQMRMNTGSSRKSSNKSSNKSSKKSGGTTSESVVSKKITPSEESKIKKVSKNIVNDLMKK
jgi:hypothetical protein